MDVEDASMKVLSEFFGVGEEPGSTSDENTRNNLTPKIPLQVGYSGFLIEFQRCLAINKFYVVLRWYGGGNSTSAEEVLQIPASLP